MGLPGLTKVLASKLFAGLPTVAAVKSMPSTLGWDTTAFPVTVSLHDLHGRGSNVGVVSPTPTAMFDAFSTVRTAPAATFYVSYTSGLDTNPGTSGSPVQSINKAVVLGNATGAPYKVSIAKDVYARAYQMGAAYPTQDCAFEFTGGRSIVGTWDRFSTPSALDATYTNCYVISITSCDKICDTQTFNRFGDYTELTNVPTRLKCNATPNSWMVTRATRTVTDGVLNSTTTITSATAAFNSDDVGRAISGTGIPGGTTISAVASATSATLSASATATATSVSLTITATAQIYINRADGAAPSSVNTRIFRPLTRNMSFQQRNINIWIGGQTAYDGADFEGGAFHGVLEYDTTATGVATADRAFVVENCSFRYAGGLSLPQDRCVSIESFRGLVVFSNCHASQSATDNWNFHDTNGATRMFVLMVNCSGFDAGRQQATCQGLTSHDDIVMIDVAGDYRWSHGGVIRCIGNSKQWLVGTVVREDYGDLPYTSGAVPPSGIRMDDHAEAWLDSVKTDMPSGTRALSASDPTAKIHTRNMPPRRSADSGLGTIDTY